MSDSGSSNDKMLIGPAQHLFLWSILLNRMELAKIFLQSSQDNIASAIVGASLLRALSKFSGHREDYEVRASYNRNSMYMEEIATVLLKISWQKDRKKTGDMLVRKAETFGNATVLSLAYNAGMEDFMAQPACNHKLCELWRGDICVSNHYFKIFLVALCPILLPTLTFNQSPEEDNSSLASIGGHGDCRVFARIKIILAFYASATRKLFSSPFAKATYYTIGCLFHLIVYTLLMTTELRNLYIVAPNVTYYNATYNLPSYCISYYCCLFIDLTGIGCLELLTYLCTFALFVDDIRKFFDMESYSMEHNLKNWWSSFWNYVDALFYLLFFMGLGLRFTPPPTNLTESTLVGWTNWWWAGGLGMRYARFFHFFYVFEALGTKAIMIAHMMKDLILFMVIFCMAVFAFGAIELAGTSPRTPFSEALLFNITYRAFFQIYGELFLDEFRSEEGAEWMLIAIYLLTTNILLINLLIATFSYTFQQIQDKSDTLLRYNFYPIVYDYLHIPVIPVFGSIISILFRRRRCCLGCCADGCCRVLYRCALLNAKVKGLCVKLSPEQNKVINKFLQLITESHFRSHVHTTSQHSTDDITSVGRTRSQRFKEIERSSHRIEQRLSEIRGDFRKDINAELKGLLKQTGAVTTEQEHTRMRRSHQVISRTPTVYW